MQKCKFTMQFLHPPPYIFFFFSNNIQERSSSVIVLEKQFKFAVLKSKYNLDDDAHNEIKCIIRYRHKPMNFQVDKKMKKSIVLDTCLQSKSPWHSADSYPKYRFFFKKKNNLFTNKKNLDSTEEQKGHLLKDVFRIPDVIYYVHTTSFITSTFYLV